MAGRLQTRSKPQLLLSMSSALRAHCFSAATAQPKGAANNRGRGEERDGWLNAVLHATSPHQGEQRRPRRERPWLLPLRHREDLVVRRSGRQEKGRREAPRRALRRAPRLQVVSRLLRTHDDLGRAAAGAVEAAAASVHFERADGALSLRRRRSAQRRC